MEPELISRFRQGDRLALARLLTLAVRGEHLAEITAALPRKETKGSVIAFTGNGGVGKSTLVGKLIDVARGAGHSVGVLACDPQSPITGGALLGDRLRMGSHADDGVFIRSLATVGGQGAVAAHLDLLISLLEAFGFDFIFVETVGAGQGDTAVARWPRLSWFYCSRRVAMTYSGRRPASSKSRISRSFTRRTCRVPSKPPRRYAPRSAFPANDPCR